jgi:hypothetical protein
MNEVCEKRDASADDEDRDLNACRSGEYDETDDDGAYACARADDRAIDQRVGVAVIVIVIALAMASWDGFRPEGE